MQRDENWYKSRLGKITASRISDIMAKTKTGYSASRQNYINQLIAERLTGEVQESYTSQAMQHGIETESMARDYYETETFFNVEQVDFIHSPDGKMSGASPDGLVGDEGMLEIKCPNTSTHIETVLGAKIDKKYIYQMQWQMYCSGRQWCDFMSYDYRLKEYPAFIKRIFRDEDMIKEIQEEVDKALKEIEDKINIIRGEDNE